MMNTGRKVIIDIGGTRFTTTTSTLKNVPNTRLERLVAQTEDTVTQPVEFFFDRNPFLFEYVLDFYRTGELHLPQGRCGRAMESELEFWEIGDGDISSCCWKTFTDSIDGVKTQLKIEQQFEDLCQQKRLSELGKSTRAKIWAFLTYPRSSRGAKVYSIVINMLVALSLVMAMLATVGSLRHHLPMHFHNGTQDTASSTEAFHTQTHTRPHVAIVWADTTLACFVFLEFCIRFVVCPDKKTFLLSFSTLADIVYFLPILTLECIRWRDPMYFMVTGQEHAFVFLQWFVALRILRLHRIASAIHGFNILTLVLRASLKELLLLASLTIFAGIVFAFAIFYSEMLKNDNFPNALYGMWWALVTMTSVGYGDFYPESSLGYILGVLCAFVGLIFISLPVPIVANNFTLYYSYKERSVCDVRKKHEWLGYKRRKSSTTDKLKIEDIY